MNKKKFLWSVVYWVLFVLLLIWMCDDDGHAAPYLSGLSQIQIFMTDFANWIMLIIALVVLVATGRAADFFMGFKNAYSNTPKDIEKSEKAWKQFYITVIILTIAMAIACLFNSFQNPAGAYLYAITATSSDDYDNLAKFTRNIFWEFNRCNRVLTFGFTVLAFLLPVRWNLKK